MAYLKFDYYTDRKTTLAESLATLGRQLWDDIKLNFSAENWTDNDAMNANYLKNKRKYFDELFTISPKLKAKLVSWVKQIPGVLSLPKGEMSQLLSATNSEQRTSINTTSDGYTYGRTYDHHERNELTLQRKARINNGRNSLSYSTCSYILEDGGKAYLLFFTFDSDGIETCQVLTQNKYSRGGLGSGMDFAKVPQWGGVRKDEYMK